MIVEKRTYDFYPGKLPEFFRLYEVTGAKELQLSTLGNLVGYFTTETGTLNQTVHLWGYISLDDRMKRRASLMSNSLWQEFLSSVTPLIQQQKSVILLPTEFSPIR